MIIGTTLIVLIWVLFIGMGLPLWAGIVLTVALGVFALIGLLFYVYFFNLDMKALALIKPLFAKIYDKRKRNKAL